ncbi:hypothetical protein LZ32DRAFT_632368 [Colletotrichum eremochloae]|nr:hypothetical protein LZ32DRAFT_632368 [Colletotrichum eremochloae]
MVLLGIITILVSAIRVGGLFWLKAIVGRGRENLAIAEAELMTSTSEEVCELWNGREVMRCMGSALVAELICLMPKGIEPGENNSILDIKFGVLIYSSFTTYALRFLKNKQPVLSYAYLCAVVGTLLLVSGLILCAYVVESSIKERRLEVLSGREAYEPVWVIKTKTTISTLVTLSGFFLIAVIIMMCLRAIIRRGYADPPQSEPLPLGLSWIGL